MPGGMGRSNYDFKKVPPPKNLGDVSRYLKQLLGGFFTRFAYIVNLVWDTGHWILFLLSFIALFKGVTPVIGALISQGVLNELQSVIRGTSPNVDFFSSKVFTLLIFLFVYRIILGIINNISTAMNRVAGEQVVKQVKLKMMNKSKELDLASFDNPAFYEKMENASQEAGNRPLMILSQTFGIFSTVIEFVSYLVILFAVPDLRIATLVIIAVSIPSAIINFVYRRKNFRYMRHRSKERRQMNYYSGLLTDKDMIKEIRIFGLADVFIDRFMDVFRVYYKGLRNLIFAENGWHALVSVISGLTNLVFYIIIAMQVFSGRIMIGDYTLYTGAIASVATCIATLISSFGSIYEGTLFIDNLMSFMNEKPTVTPRLAKPLQVDRAKPHTIEFSHVSFRYPGMNKNILTDINLTINRGETVALVGLNGRGKTTLIKLLTRLYDPTRGKILLDGRDIKDYRLDSLYSTFGIIFQDFGKYAVTVSENIQFGDINKQADMQAVRDSAQRSAAGEYIDRLPRGYDTPLMRIFEPTGTELSLGQWQKLAIARAFYSDSQIMILDEPTASLDAIAEREIFSQFDQLRRDKTTIFVSHRLSSATIADKIIVLDGGRIAQQGTHSQLMETGGLYKELFTTQASRYIRREGENKAV